MAKICNTCGREINGNPIINANGSLSCYECYNQMPAPVQAQPTHTFIAAEEILKYKELLDVGAITEEEFKQKKLELLSYHPIQQQPNSTAPVQPTPVQQQQNQPMPNTYAPNTNKQQEHPRKKEIGPLGVIACTFAGIFVFLVVLGVIIGITTSGKSTPKDVDTSKDKVTSQHIESSSSSMTLKEFDNKSWEQFKNLYEAHNDLMKAMEYYSTGQMDSLKFYEYCKDKEEYFRKMSMKFDYGTTKDEKTYLSVFENFAISDQLVAQKLMKYLDSQNIKDLSSAQEYIQSANKAATTIATNRGKLLKDAGYTDSEIKEIVDKSFSSSTASSTKDKKLEPKK